MCKKFLSIVLALMMVMSAVSVNVLAQETDEAPDTVMVADSSTLSNMSKNDTYSSMSSDVTLISEKSLKLTGDGTTSGSASSESKRWAFGESYDWTTYTYINIMAKNTTEADATFRLSLGIDGANASGAKGFWYKDKLTVAPGEWSIVSAELSTFKQGYNAGDITEGSIYDVMSQIQGIFFDGINGELYVDSIWISKSVPAPATLIETSVPEGSSDILMNETSFTFTFSEALAPASKQNATVVITKNGEKAEATYQTEYSENAFTITFDNDLEPGCEYSIAVSGIVDRFGLTAENAVLNFATSVSVIFPDEIILADFTRMDDIEKAMLTADSENKIFGEKSGTLSAEKLAESPSMYPIVADNAAIPYDWSQYTHFNIWVYSKEATSDRQFALVMRSSNATSTNTAAYYVDQDFAGWKKLCVPISAFSEGKLFDITQIKDCYVSFVYGNLKEGSGKEAEWSIEKYKKVSFAKMWLSTEKSEGYSELYNSDSSSSTKSIFNKTTYAVLSTDATEGNNQSLKLYGIGDNASESKNPTFEAQNWTDYSYLNFRIKNGNEAAEDGSIPDAQFNFYATVTGSTATAAAGYWSKKNIKVTGSDWQTVSIAIPKGFSFTKNDSTPVIYTEMSHIEGLRFDYITGTLYVEKIWLSDRDSSAAPVLESISAENNSSLSAFTRKIDFTYSEALSSGAPTVTVSPEADFITDVSGNTVSVIFPDGLASDKAYTVTVGDDVKSVFGVKSGKSESVSFTTEKYSAERSDSAVFASFASDDASGKMFIAVYDSEGIMENIYVTNAIANNGVLSLKNDYAAIGEGKSAKIFVWEGTSLKPLTNPVLFN